MTARSFRLLGLIGVCAAAACAHDLRAQVIGTPAAVQYRTAGPPVPLNPAATVVVAPANMRGWAFYDDERGVACANPSACHMVEGPAVQPFRTGSAELSTPLATDAKALVLADYNGTRFDRITTLEYSTYRQSADSTDDLGIALQINIDYDLTDTTTAYQGRLVFEPYVGIGLNVLRSRWQTWDAMDGKWWGTQSSVPARNIVVANPCTLSTPCTWAQLLAAFPNLGVHATYGAVLLEAASGHPGFRGNVDGFTIGIVGHNTVFDFELTPVPVPAIPPDSEPADDNALADTISGGNHSEGVFLRDLVVVEFERTATQADRQAAIDAVNGIVVGGLRTGDSTGLYLVRVPSDGTADPLFHAARLLERFPHVAIAMADQVLSHMIEDPGPAPPPNAPTRPAPLVAPTPPPPDVVPTPVAPGGIEVLLESWQSGFDDPLRQIVSDSATFASLWDKAFAGQSHPPSLPHVDFSSDEVIVAATGVQDGSWNTVRIGQIGDFLGREHESISVDLFGRVGCASPTAPARPVVMVRHHRTPALMPAFGEQLRLQPCDAMVAVPRPDVAAARADSVTPEDIEILRDAKQSRFDEALRQVVRDSATFAALWRKSFTTDERALPLPHVDFETDEVVVVATGAHEATANAVSIKGVERHPFELVVLVEMPMRSGICGRMQARDQRTAPPQPVVMVRHHRAPGLVTIFRDRFGPPICMARGQPR